MGIRPNRDGIIPPVTPDNPETRYSDWLTDLEDSGEIVGGVWKETDAKATSANSGTSDLAGRVAALEAVSSTSGTGWVAHKRSDVVSLLIQGKTLGFTLPFGFRPRSTIYAGVVTEAGQPAGRVSVDTSGLVSFFEPPPSLAYGHLTFIAA